jgi:hypothetical protein
MSRIFKYSLFVWPSTNSSHRHAYNAVLSLKSSQWILETLELLPEVTQPRITAEELIACETGVRNDAGVQKLAKDVGKPLTSI